MLFRYLGRHCLYGLHPLVRIRREKSSVVHFAHRASKDGLAWTRFEKTKKPSESTCRTMIGSGSALEMLPEKVQCHRPGLLGGIGVITFRIIVAMKSVLSPRIDLIRVGFVVFPHRLFGAWNALVHGWISLSIVRQHRRLNVFHQVERLRTAAIENHGSLESANLCRRRECHLAAPAKTDEPNAISPYIRKSSKKDKTRVDIFRDAVPGGEIADIA